MTRLEKIAAEVAKKGLDAALITGQENIQYATGFIALEGMVLITAEGKGFCYTDSRYIEAAEKIVGPKGYEVIEPDVSYPQCAANLKDKLGLSKIGFEDRVMPVAELEAYEAKIGLSLLPMGNFYEVLREFKEPEEIDLMVKAQRIA